MPIEIKPLDTVLAPHFARLNRAWIERLFALEPADEEILANPQELVEQGGAVVFVLVDGEVVGTGGLQRLDDSTAEIVKMAVDPAHQGKGLGGRVMQALLQAATKQGFRRAYIETNSSLAASNGLYRKYGFTPTGQTASLHGYARADIFYEKNLGDGCD
ncbi:MAG: hypothetical protein SynsKO_19930 [Synoicihabitans sp.]